MSVLNEIERVVRAVDDSLQIAQHRVNRLELPQRARTGWPALVVCTEAMRALCSRSQARPSRRQARRPGKRRPSPRARQLARVARRVGLGLARTGSVAHNGSGDIFCAVSTANRLSRNATGRATIELLTDGSINDVFSAVVDATEESVCNALFVADTVVGVGGHTVPGLPVDRVMDLINQK